MRFCAFSTENTRMALNRGNERLPCLQPKIRSGNGRSVFSRSGIVRSRARFTQLTNHYGGLGICVRYVVLYGIRVSRAMLNDDGSWEESRNQAKKNVCLSGQYQRHGMFNRSVIIS